MGNPLLPDTSSKGLGLWIFVTAILLGLMASAISVESQSGQSVSAIHENPPPLVSKRAPAREPIVIAALDSVWLNSGDWENIHATPDDIVPPAASIPDPKPQDTGIPLKKVSPVHGSPVRGKKAERLYRPIIFRVAHRHRIDPAMVQAIIMAESSFNPNAISKRGAAGLMQLMPNTAKALGVKDIFDPEHNINGGVLYFKKLLKEFGCDVKLALAAYNAGSRKVKEYQGVPPFKTTQIYIKKVFEYYQHYKKLSATEDGWA
jgi:hypothetical protein